MSTYRKLEDLEVYRRLCRLHIEICDLSHRWPAEEKYELGSQVRRSSNSAAAQIAEKYDDRHVRNKIEGVNRSRGEAAETLHHLYMAFLKGYEAQAIYDQYKESYQECVRMLNGLEKALEQHSPERERRWPNSLHEDVHDDYQPDSGFLEPLNPEPQPLNP